MPDFTDEGAFAGTERWRALEGAWEEKGLDQKV